jgi:hypothetical protein
MTAKSHNPLLCQELEKKWTGVTNASPVARQGLTLNESPHQEQLRALSNPAIRKE